MAMCLMMFLAPEPEPAKSVTFAQRNVRNFTDTSNLLDSQYVKFYFYLGGGPYRGSYG